MSLGVEFEESEFMKKTIQKNTTEGVTSSLIKNGWAHDQASANRLLIFVSILIILASVIVYYVLVSRPANNQKINIPETVIKRLSPELQMQIRAAQR